MRYAIKRSPNDPTQFQLILEAQNSEENNALRALATGGSIIALGETDKGHAELVLGTTHELGR